MITVWWVGDGMEPAQLRDYLEEDQEAGRFLWLDVMPRTGETIRCLDCSRTGTDDIELIVVGVMHTPGHPDFGNSGTVGVYVDLIDDDDSRD
jgi:hypothetical protein